jgi:PAS domain S-box-containing protein
LPRMVTSPKWCGLMIVPSRPPKKMRSAVSAEFDSLVKILDLANVIIHDVEGKIFEWTTGGERLYGWTRQEAVGQVVHDLLQTKYPVPRGEIVAALRGRGSWEGEFEHRTKAGLGVSIASPWVARKSEERQSALYCRTIST